MQPANSLIAQEAICTNVEPCSNLNSLIYLGCKSRAAADQSERHLELGYSVQGPLLRGKWLTADFAKRKSASSTAMNTGQPRLIIVIPVSDSDVMQTLSAFKPNAESWRHRRCFD